MIVFVNIKRLDPNAKIPAYADGGSSGFDLCAVEDTLILPNERALVKTGLAMAIPEGFEVQIRPRSGLALKNGITVLNTPGTIDASYRGEIGIVLYNTGTTTFVVKKGDRIAQGVLQEVPKVVFREVDTLDETSRGAGGFGSTGV